MKDQSSIDKIIRRIKKCLALAKSSNANESATALRQAQALMEKYNINQTDVDLSEVSKESRKAGEFETPPLYITKLARMIGDAFAVEPLYFSEYVYRSGRFVTVKSIEFIGTGIHPKIAAYSFEVLLRQLKKDRNEFIKTQRRFKPANRTRRADAFCEAWIDAVWEKVQNLAVSEKQSALIQQYKENNYKNLGAAKSRTNSYHQKDSGAQESGYLAGKNAYLNHGVDSNSKPRLLK